MTVAQAIARSAAHHEIVWLEYSLGRALALVGASEGSAFGNDERREYWGHDADGHPWRVHLRPPVGRARGLAP